MDIQIKYFQSKPSFELTAAQIGISKWDWVSITKRNSEQAKFQMNKNKFDILPIEMNGGFKSYYKAKQFGNYSSIEECLILETDKIYFRTGFIDVVKKMIRSSQEYFFLTDSENILGLISLNNLNSLVVYNFLYQVISGLEKNVSEFLKSTTTESEIIEILLNTSDKQAKSTAEIYLKSIENNTNNSIYEQLYFSTFSCILKNLESKLKGNHRELLQYRKNFSSENIYGKLRNSVAHPIKPVFENLNDLKSVIQLIEDSMKIREIIGSIV